MNYTWVPTSVYGAMPPNAVFAGTDSDSSPIYVGRTFHDGDQLPAKVIPSKQAAYVSHNGNEIVKHHVEVLVGTGFTWIHSGNGHVPPNAVRAGQTVHGQPLYVGRTHHEGSLTPGKIHPSHGCLYFPYGGAEQSSLQYEVLCGQPASRWVPTAAHAGVPPDAVVAGHDSDGSPIYVGRAFHEGDQLPAKVIPSKQIAYVSHNGQEIPKHHFEVFCHSSVSWVSSGHGSVPPNAVRAGNTSTGEPLYVGRTFYQGSLTPGKIHPSHGSLYIPYGGAEIPFKNYEVLIEN
ncbi:uncharacterized protein LOC129794238 [Lutzomyia longipalpis]|uniref:uncharacterized protein LOC129794238 n=1 Tax=Lutzomyia longipalpis TaxID=7200 RepID=UPI0024842664|nr:uncharacterized protein LOC129794238 [Lutzomyia longipalpis]